MTYLDWLLGAWPLVAPQGKLHLCQHDDPTKPPGFSPQCHSGIWAGSAKNWICCCLGCRVPEPPTQLYSQANTSELLAAPVPTQPRVARALRARVTGACVPTWALLAALLHSQPTHPAQAMPLAFVALLPALLAAWFSAQIFEAV